VASVVTDFEAHAYGWRLRGFVLVASEETKRDWWRARPGGRRRCYGHPDRRKILRSRGHARHQASTGLRDDLLVCWS